MTLKSLFKKRKQLYYKKLLKYLRYIFNDHFSIVLFFLVGAGGYAYSNYLENLTAGNHLSGFFLLILFFLLSIKNSVKLIVEAADQVFLIAKEEKFYPILKKEVIKSYLQSLITIIVLVFISYPIFVITRNFGKSEGILLFLTIASLKWLNLMVKIYPYFYSKEKTYQKYRLIMQTFTFIILAMVIFIDVKIFSLISLFLAFFLFYLFLKEKIYFNHLLKWNQMIDEEQSRLNKLYRFIAVFVDVPQVTSGVKAFPFLNPIINKMTKAYPKAPYYYSLRMVIRNTEYRSLIIRLNLLAIFILSITPSYILSFVFVIFFIYLLGFQLISIVQMNQSVQQFKIYPVSEKDKVDAALYLINQILILMAIVLGITGTINLGWLGLSFFPLGVLVCYLFSYYYVAYRLKSHKIS